MKKRKKRIPEELDKYIDRIFHLPKLPDKIDGKQKEAK